MSDNNPQSKSACESTNAVARARAELMTGRGQGASEEEVFSHQRGKLVQAGEPVVRRLAETARDAAHARSGVDSSFVDGGLAVSPGQAGERLSQPRTGSGVFPSEGWTWIHEIRRERLKLIGAAFVLTGLLVVQRNRRHILRSKAGAG